MKYGNTWDQLPSPHEGGAGSRYDIKRQALETPPARFLVRAFCAGRLDMLESQSMKGDTRSIVLTTRLGLGDLLCCGYLRSTRPTGLSGTACCIADSPHRHQHQDEHEASLSTQRLGKLLRPKSMAASTFDPKALSLPMLRPSSIHSILLESNTCHTRY